MYKNNKPRYTLITHTYSRAFGVFRGQNNCSAVKKIPWL